MIVNITGRKPVIITGTTNRKATMYTAQKNAHGNIIVCKGADVRNSYRIVYSGTYAECLRFKALGE